MHDHLQKRIEALRRRLNPSPDDFQTSYLPFHKVTLASVCNEPNTSSFSKHQSILRELAFRFWYRGLRVFLGLKDGAKGNVPRRDRGVRGVEYTYIGRPVLLA